MLRSQILLTVSFLIIILIFRFFFFFKEADVRYYDGQPLQLETTLLSEPKISGKTQKFNVDYKTNRIFVTTSLFPTLHYGDKLLISGNLKVKLLDGRKELYVLNFPKIEARKNNLNPLLAITSIIRQKIISFFERNLSPNSSGLMLGIVFGIKEGIPKEFYEDLRKTGVLHVIAASGMNVTMVGGFLNSIFILFFRRQISLILSIFGILFYAVLAGGEPSIVRASIMGSLVFIAQILGRQAWAAFILFLTGYFMLLWNPKLLFDIGFQLSFLATTGLLFIKPISSHQILDTFQTTIIAQIATFPVIIANFGTYSLWSVLVNGLVLWTVPVIMVLGGISAILSFVIEPLARLILLISLPIAIYFEIVIRFFSGLGGSVNFGLNWLEIAGYYLVVGALILARTR